jgi:polyphosphate glucokinase
MSTGIAIGVDVGGSAIKAGAVDTASGRLVGSRRRVATPRPSTPSAVVAVIAGLVARIEHETGAPPAGVGAGVPSVVIGGVTKSAANIDQAWIAFDAGGALEAAIGRPVLVLNDADAAGLAEMRFGAGAGRRGTVFVLTLGTGLGSALFTDGKLVPNTELGHMEIRGGDAEHRSAAVARVRDKLSWKAWAADLDEHLHAIDRLFWPDLIILGGGVSQDADRFLPYLTVRPPVVPAELRNDAGIAGAAMAAAEAAGT